MTILLGVLERNQNLRMMSVKVLDYNFSIRQNLDALYFARCNKVCVFCKNKQS